MGTGERQRRAGGRYRGVCSGCLAPFVELVLESQAHLVRLDGVDRFRDSNDPCQVGARFLFRPVEVWLSLLAMCHKAQQSGRTYPIGAT